MDTKMPNTSHPALAGIEVTQDVAAVNIPTVGINKAPDPELISHGFPTVRMVRRKCAAPAPFIGDPRMVKGGYSWPVWIDDSGEWWIAGDASLDIGPRP